MGEASSRIREAIESRNLSGLIGASESSDFEAKGPNPYDLSSAAGQFELAKDVSAMANGGGGWIVIGLNTTQKQQLNLDQVGALNLITQDQFPRNKIIGLLKEYVYPELSGLSVNWVEDSTTSGTGVGVIHVPPQPLDRQPFLIAKVVESGKRLKQIVFGFVRRVDDDAVPHSLDRLHHAVRNGMSSTAHRLTLIEEKLSLLLDQGTRVVSLQTTAVEEKQHRSAVSDRVNDALRA